MPANLRIAEENKKELRILKTTQKIKKIKPTHWVLLCVIAPRKNDYHRACNVL
jgi:hypothetical protein